MAKSLIGRIYFGLTTLGLLIGIYVYLRNSNLLETQIGFIAQVFSFILFSFTGLLAFKNYREKHGKFLIVFFFAMGFGDLEYGIINNFLRSGSERLPDIFTLISLLPYTVSMVSLAIFSTIECFRSIRKNDLKVLSPLFIGIFAIFISISYNLILSHQFDPGYSRPWFVRTLSWSYGISQALSVAGLIISVIRTVSVSEILIYNALVALMSVDLVLRYQDISAISFETVLFEYLSLGCLSVVCLSLLNQKSRKENNLDLFSLKSGLSLISLFVLIGSHIPFFLISGLVDRFGVFFSASVVTFNIVIWSLVNIALVYAYRIRKNAAQKFFEQYLSLNWLEDLVFNAFGLSGHERTFHQNLILENKSNGENRERLSKLDTFLHNSEVHLVVLKHALGLIPKESPYSVLARDSVNNLRSMIASLDGSLSSGRTGRKTFLAETIDGAVNHVRIYFEHQKKFGIDVQMDIKPSLQLLCVNGDDSLLSQALINFLKNSGESIVEDGTIKVELKESKEFAVIRITDTGCGMSRDIRGIYGKRSFTTKDKGKGIGAIESVSSIYEMGGEVNLVSHEEIGTILDISIPKVPTPDCFVRQILLCDDVIILDDSNETIDLLSFVIAQKFPSIKVHRCIDLAEFNDILFNFRSSNQKFTTLVDYDLGEADFSGIEVIENLKFDCPKYLITSSWAEVFELCTLKGIKVLPKHLIQFAQFRHEPTKSSNARLVVIDDNPIIHELYAIESNKYKVDYLGVQSLSDYENYLGQFRIEDFVVVDRNLGWSNGASIAVNLKESIKNVSMTTGGELSREELKKEVAPFNIKVLDSKSYPSELFS